jgi:hypothetical protein
VIFPHTCPHCGAVTEPLLIQVAQVVNVCCYECNTHLEYCTPGDLPTLETIKQATWEIAECNIVTIDIAKKSLQFTPAQREDFSQVKYYRLYLAISVVKKIEKVFAGITNRITFV